MEENKKAPCPKKTYKKVGFELKLFVIAQIQNGQISANHAAKKYDISRSSIQYWIKKYSTLEQKKFGMSKQDEIKKWLFRFDLCQSYRYVCATYFGSNRAIFFKLLNI